jgi:transcriptional regulator with XRE-family HTH domain
MVDQVGSGRSTQPRRCLMKMEVSVIKALRIAKGFTQRELARCAGISSGSLSNYENGVAEASPAVVRRLAAALECQPEDLANGLVAAYLAAPVKVRGDNAVLRGQQQ